MDYPGFSILGAIGRVPPHAAFTPTTLLDALHTFQRGRDVEPRNFVTPAELETALVIAAQLGIVREVEIAPGEFVIIRIREYLPEELDSGVLEGWTPRFSQPETDQLGRALDISVETVALRRAILDPIQFSWTMHDYAALLNAVHAAGRRGE